MLNKKLIFLLLLGFFAHFCVAKEQECTTSIETDGTLTDDCPGQYNCVDQICVHKDIFPLNGKEIACSILIMGIAGLANSGGIGGGSILSPILLILFQYDASKAIMLVYVLIFGGSLGTSLNVAFQRDIKTGKPIVLYDFMLIVSPVMLIGSNIGVVLNRMIAPILTIGGLVYLMVTTLMKISKKAKSSYAQETKELSKPLLASPIKTKNMTQEVELDLINKRSQSGVEENSLPQEVKEILAEDDSFLPKTKLYLLLCLLCFMILVTLLRGTDKVHSFIGVEFCSAGYWFWYIFGLAGCYFFYIKGSQIVLRNNKLKNRYNCNDNNYKIDEHYIKKLGMLGVLAGVLAALLGIGGGLVLGTTLMAMGVEPQSMTATSNAFVVLTSFISLFQAFLFGGISTNELIFFFLISSIGSYSVSAGLSYLVKKTRRPSLLLIILSGMLTIALVMTPTFAIWKSIENPSQMLGFNSIC